MNNILPKWVNLINLNNKNAFSIISFALFIIEIDDLVKLEEIKMFNEADYYRLYS